VKRCCIHYAAPNGRIYPFCTYNSGPVFREKIERQFPSPWMSGGSGTVPWKRRITISAGRERPNDRKKREALNASLFLCPGKDRERIIRVCSRGGFETAPTTFEERGDQCFFSTQGLSTQHFWGFFCLRSLLLLLGRLRPGGRFGRGGLVVAVQKKNSKQSPGWWARPGRSRLPLRERRR